MLRPAEWRLNPTTLGAAAETPDNFRKALAEQRAEWLLPRHVYLANGDVRLLLDLDDADHTEQLRREVRRLDQGQLLLQEALPGLNDAWLPGPGGHYVTEIVVSLTRRSVDGEVSRLPSANRAEPALRRMVPPGGHWLYLKLYGSPENEEDLLAGPIAAFCKETRCC